MFTVVPLTGTGELILAKLPVIDFAVSILNCWPSARAKLLIDCIVKSPASTAGYSGRLRLL